jgi:penicillin G amidase
MMKRVLTLTLTIGLLCTTLALTPKQPIAQSQMQSANLKVVGVRAPVTVRRDERGIPYIEAANDHDLYFAQGYVTAGDRLWQMDLLRRTARGELAEIFGARVLEEDKRHRTYGFARHSEAMAAKLTGAGRALSDAYAQGVNAYIASRTEGSLPVEFRILKYKPRLWTAADSIVIGLLMHESLTNSWQLDVMRAALSDLPAERVHELLPEFSELDTPVVGSDKVNGKAKAANKVARTVGVSKELLAAAFREQDLRERSLDRVGLHAEELAASNNWVVSGKRTATGKPLLASDPHLALSVPSIWYMVNLSAPGVRVAGVSIPGLHAVIIGHNERIAWGLTNIGPDVQDLYREKFDAANPKRYQTPRGWQEAEVRIEEIKVRKVPTDPAIETIAHEVTVTRHGPIVVENKGERLALRWSALDPSLDYVMSFHRLNRAGNWKEFCAAISNFAGAPQNHVYADVDGHIGYYGARYIPIRKSGDGSVPYDGTTDDGEWTGWIPFEQLPHVFDPPAGYIATANARIVGRDYPHFISHSWAAPYRQRRIHDLLQQNKKFTIQDFRAIQGDDYSIGGKRFAEAMLKFFNGAQARTSAVSSENGSSTMGATLGTIAAWDGRVEPNSRGALLINEIRITFFLRVLKNAIGEERMRLYRWGNRDIFIDNLIATWPQQWLPKEFKSWKDLLIACEQEARANLTKQLGADESKWTYGNATQIRFNHPLASAPLIGNQFKIDSLPQRGSGGTGVGATPNVGPSVSMRLIADTSNWDNTQQGFQTGQSGDPTSPHYKDQVMDWYNVTPRVFPFSKAAVQNAAKQTLTLVPAN